MCCVQLPNDIWINIMIVAEKLHRRDTRDYHTRRYPTYHVEENPLTEAVQGIKHWGEKYRRKLAISETHGVDWMSAERGVRNHMTNAYLSMRGEDHVTIGINSFQLLLAKPYHHFNGKRMKLTAPKKGKRKAAKRYRDWEDGAKKYNQFVFDFYQQPGNYDFSARALEY
jgi:hypothetical protein